MSETATHPVVKLTPFQEWNKIPDGQQQISSGEETPAAEAAVELEPKTVPAPEPEKPAEEDEEKKPLSKGLQKRFNQLTSEIRDLKAQLAKPATSEEKPGTATPPKTDEVKADQKGKPVAANFTTYEEFVEALTDWKADQRDALRKQVEAQQSQQQIVRAQIDAARARYADYDQVVNDQVVISPAMAEVMIAQEHGADVAYHLGKHPDEAARIARLAPVQAAIALAKIEASLDLGTPAKPEPKAVTSKAPAPPKIVSGSSGDGDPEPDPKQYSKWEKWYDRELKRNAGK